MNARKAKALRKLAQAATIGKPNVEYDVYLPSVYQQIGGIPIKVQPGIPRELSKDCTRAVYQSMK